MSWGRVATAILALSYPALVYLGLNAFEPRVLGVGLMVLIVIRHRKIARGFFRHTDAIERSLFAALVVLSIGIMIANSETLLRLYPGVLSLGMFLIFFRSLANPPSMIERFARMQDPELSATGVRYTYRVTQVWCCFLAGNGMIALMTVFTSREIWVLWNGLLSYVLMGSLFAGEWLLRRRLMHFMEHAS